jgi:hypothetical protein
MLISLKKNRAAWWLKQELKQIAASQRVNNQLFKAGFTGLAPVEVQLKRRARMGPRSGVEAVVELKDEGTP